MNKFLKNKPVKWVALVFAVLLVYLGYTLFFPNISPSKGEKAYLCIPENSSFDDVVSRLKDNASVYNSFSFRQAATLLRYKKVKAGRYEISGAMSNFSLIRKLRSGRQIPVKLTFNNIRTKEQLAGRLAGQLMTDSTSILKLLNDSAYLAKFQLDSNTSVALFIPNTYEVFWNINAYQLFDRMYKEYQRFWTPERIAKADAIPLTQVQVATLASIVEEESNSRTDRPMVAGLYINRLKAGMPLQADPTIKFALKNFELKRILFEHLRVKSPYNTYKNEGLPPGPIRVASPAGIDAVLNYVHHDYMYMCANATLNGMHEFAATYNEHEANAKKYQEALNRLNIK